VIAVDASAVVAILRLEPEAEVFLRRIGEAAASCMSAVSLQEASMVLAGRAADETSWLELDRILQDLDVEIIPHSAELARIAREAFLRFGKGRHPARLNCGDCASYAVAKKYSIPLLFKGADFARTDIVPAFVAPA
jgi:ribonuclease VapC